MEKSIYEQLNEIDDTESLQEESARAKLKRAFPELNFGDDSDNNSLKDKDSEPKTLDQAAREKSPLELADEYIPTEEEVKALIGLSINEMIDKLTKLKEEKFNEIHPKPSMSTREKLRSMGYDV